MSERFCLKWNDFETNVSKSFGLLRNEDYLHDVTLVCDDNKQVSTHKLVLSACSEFFKSIFKNNRHQNPLICLEGISSQELQDILDYMYNGETNIFQEGLSCVEKRSGQGIHIKITNLFIIGPDKFFGLSRSEYKTLLTATNPINF